MTRLQRALATPPPPPEPVAASDDDDANDVGAPGPPIVRLPRPVPPTTDPRPAGPPLPTEDVRTWQPLFVVDDGDLPLAMGTTARVSPLAQARWRPWLQAQLAALRQAWSQTVTRCALPASRPTALRGAGFADVEGFRPWGPLLLGRDVQARVDDGELVRMVRTTAADERAAEALYGSLTRCLHDAAKAAPLPAPPH